MVETEYKNESVTASCNILFAASDVLNFTLGGSYIESKGKMDVGPMPEVPQEVIDNIETANYDFSSIGFYSDLSYKMYTASLGAEYILSPRMSLTTDVVYYDLTDDTGYVYGIETGSLYMVRSGVRIGL